MVFDNFLFLLSDEQGFLSHFWVFPLPAFLIVLYKSLTVIDGGSGGLWDLLLPLFSVVVLH